jgi:cytochrome P450
MRTLVLDRLANSGEDGTCDLAQDVAARLSVETIATLVGIDEGDRDSVVDWAHEAFAAGTALTAHPEMMVCILELMEERRARPADDLMSALVDRSVEGAPLSDKEVLLNCENLLGASENLGLSVAAGLAALIDYPGEFARLRDDRRLLPTAVEEVFRWASSAVHSQRTVAREATVAGVTLAPGDLVVLWVPSANRDEALFAAPDRFDVGRSPNRHLALGFGEHVCVGNSLARLQARIVLATVLDHVRTLEPAGPVVPVHSIAVRGPAHLPVRVTLR